MFGTWISDVQQALLAKFPAERAYNAEDLKSPQMPTAVGHFLGHALKRRAGRIEFSVETEWFDPDAEEVKAAFDAYREALTSTARYPKSVWKSSLERGVQFVIMHIANPAYGLVSFVFGDSDDPVSVQRVVERLNYFGTHPGLKQGIVRSLEEMKASEIGPEDLRAVILKVDRALVSEFEPADWVEHLAPLFEIAGAVRENEKTDPALPTDLLKAFFEQKNCDDIVSRLEAVESVKGVHTLTAEVLRRAAGEKPEPPAAEVVELEEPQVQVKRVVRNDIHREDEPSVVPRWMQFASGKTPAEKNTPTPVRASVTPPVRASVPPPLSVDDPAVDDESGPFERDDPDATGKIGQRAPVPDDLGIVTSGDGVEQPDALHADEPEVPASAPRWTQFREASAKSRPSPQVENTAAEERVMGRLNAVQRAWYINHLFGSDREHWKSVMEQLDEAGDWGEASEIIASEVFERHGVDIYSRPAVDFTNAVEARFR